MSILDIVEEIGEAIGVCLNLCSSICKKIDGMVIVVCGLMLDQNIVALCSPKIHPIEV